MFHVLLQLQLFYNVRHPADGHSPKFTLGPNKRGDVHQNPINLTHERKEGLLFSIVVNMSSCYRLNCGR